MSTDTYTQITFSNEIISALKEMIIIALQSGFNKTSYIVTDHVKYIKKIQTADDPEGFIRYTAKKLFPNDESYNEKIRHINVKYQDKLDLLSAFDKLYRLYYTLPKDKIVKCRITEEEAEKILDSLLV